MMADKRKYVAGVWRQDGRYVGCVTVQEVAISVDAETPWAALAMMADRLRDMMVVLAEVQMEDQARSKQKQDGEIHKRNASGDEGS